MTSTIIDAHVAHCRRQLDELSEATITERRRVLYQADRELPYGLRRANGLEIQTWLVSRKLKPATRHAYRGHLNGFYTWACDPDDPWLSHNPTSRLPRIRVPRGLPHPATIGEVAVALRLLPKPLDLAVLLATYAGLRCSDIAGLRREDVTEAMIVVRCGKGGKPAILPTHPAIWKAVEPLPDGLVVPLSPGTMEPRRKLSRYLWWHLKRIGLPHLSAHSFRHTFGTELYRATQDLRCTQELMRHASPATTAIYTLIGDGKRRDAIAALPAVA